jgi:TldD protein
LHALAARAVDAARSAGADYADARLTLTRQQIPGDSEGEDRGFGVRVLVHGYWGFLASAVWTPDEAARLARAAVAQANAHRRGKSRPVVLGTIPVVAGGEWVMPVKYDPFDIPIEEKLDVMRSFQAIARAARVGIGVQAGMRFMRQHQIFASSEGSFWAQTTYGSSASFAVSYMSEYHAGLPRGGAAADFLSTAGRGWEHVSESGIPEAIPQLIEEAERARHRVPIDVGRYDIVFNAEAMASLVDETIGAATELDRALGYEADASGTSYLDDPLAMLGQQRVASPNVTVTANRSVPTGAATVRWDDEGVVPDEFPIVADGMLIDYQTTREQAAWLAPYYQQRGLPIRSHGCAAAGSALDITMQHAPNLALRPGREAVTFEELVASTEKGIAMFDVKLAMDQQQLNGVGRGTMREIVRGKLGRFVYGGALAFRSPELWKTVAGIGGPGTERLFGQSRSKGQPAQQTVHSVSAVPAKIPQLSIIDLTRKA